MSTHLLITVSSYFWIFFSTTKHIIGTFISIFFCVLFKKMYASLFMHTLIYNKETVKSVNVDSLLFIVLSLDLKNKTKKNQNVYFILNINIKNKCFYCPLSLLGRHL